MSRDSAVVALFLALLSGCGAAPDALPEGVAATSQPITAGVVESQQDTGVVGVLDLDLHTLCTGVLLTDRIVVTARHCLAPANLDNGTVNCASTVFGTETSADNLVVTTGGAEPSDRHTVVRVMVPDDKSFCNGDLAALVLSEPLDPNVAKPIELALDDEVKQGDAFSAVGIGRTDTDPSGTRRRRDGLSVQCVGNDCANAMVGSREWWGDGAVCEGDSGGPAINKDGKVVGIASRKRAGCTATIYADVASNSDFFYVAMGESKKTPVTPKTVAQCSASPGKHGSYAFAMFGLVLTLGARYRRARRPR